MTEITDKKILNIGLQLAQKQAKNKTKRKQMNGRVALIAGDNRLIKETLADYLFLEGWQPILWERLAIKERTYQDMENYVLSCRPSVVFFINEDIAHRRLVTSEGTVSYAGRSAQWLSEVAWITRLHGIKLVVTSNHQVYGEQLAGPYFVGSPTNPTSQLGREMLELENHVRHQNPNVIIARLGWQIGDFSDSSDMLAYLAKEAEESAVIYAGRDYFPSCSFVERTVVTLVRLAKKQEAGLYCLNSNRGWSFYEIANALAEYLHKTWRIVDNQSLTGNRLMIDQRLKVKNLRKDLRSLPKIK